MERVACKICDTDLIPDGWVCPNCKRLHDLFMTLHDHSSIISIHMFDFIDKAQAIVYGLASMQHPLLTQGLRWEIESYVHGMRISYKHADNVVNRFPVLISSLNGGKDAKLD